MLLNNGYGVKDKLLLIMTQEDKKLLLKDLCARLPYGVKVKLGDNPNIFDLEYRIKFAVMYGDSDKLEDILDITNIKPYLLPLSSMDEEQKREYNRWKHDIPVCHYEYGDVVEEIELYDSPESFEYLIENHFDYRGLIPKGLAIDATDKNIY